MIISCCSLCLKSQDSARVIKKKIEYYKKNYQKVKSPRKADFTLTTYELEGGIRQEEKVLLVSNQLIYRRFYKDEIGVGVWKEYSKEYGLLDIKTSPLPYCTDSLESKDSSKTDSIQKDCIYPRYNDVKDGLFHDIAINTRYPAYARDNRISGDVYMQFEVDTLGYVKDICIIKGVHPVLDLEAYRAVQLLHRFKYPGIQDGEVKSITLTLPIRYTIH